MPALSIYSLARAASLLAATALLAACNPAPIVILQPADGLLTLPGDQAVIAQLPLDVDPGSVMLEFDGAPIAAQLVLGGRFLNATVVGVGPGDHTIALSATSPAGNFTTQVGFHAADLANPAECDVLNNAECVLPYPSDRFRVPAPTPAGFEVQFPAAGLPTVVGDPLDPAIFAGVDGFSPTAQILMNFPQGVDLAASNAAVLQEPDCCNQPPGPPWIETRTHTDRSREVDSPTVLLDTVTGERILHWVELDARTSDPTRQILFLRPAVGLVPGRRYIVAVRGLIDPVGDLVSAEPAFGAIRDLTPTDVPGLSERQIRYWLEVFPALVAAGVGVPDLQLAFDFTVASQDNLQRQMLAMRDAGLAWVDAQIATPGTQLFTVQSSTENTCTPGSAGIYRRVTGTYQSPLFLSSVPVSLGAPQHSVDANDLPVMNGTMDSPFTITIPCAALEAGVELHPLLLGHGLFGDGRGMVDAIGGSVVNFLNTPGTGLVAEWNYIAGGTDFRGLAAPDLTWVALEVIGLGNSKLNSFPALPDRLRQGMLNTLVLGHLMDQGHFNVAPEFQLPGGAGAFPGASSEMYYYGISLGGVMGTWYAALSPDLEKLHIDVPSINFSILLQRSTQFTTFESVFGSIGLSEPMDFALGISLLHELWVSAEPAATARHVTGTIEAPLPGSPAKKLLMSVAWLDKQVSNQGSEIAARTLGLPSLDGSLQQQLVDIPDVAGPQDSAMVVWDTGAFDILDPAQTPFIPPLANQIPSEVCDPHGDRPAIPAGVQMMLDFFQPGGVIENTCDGICDADTPFEQPFGGICALPLP